MSTIKRKCKVVMIEVSGNSVRPLLVNPYSKKMEVPKHQHGYPAIEYQYAGYKPYQLYFVNHDKINFDDYYLNNIVSSNIRIGINNGLNDESFYRSKDIMKVIASTENSLGLPKPSQKFIEKFVSEYNKGNILDEVNIEFVVENLNEIFDKVKTNSKNEITVSKVKTSWDESEVIELIRKFSSYKTHSFTSDDLNWVKNNL